MKSYNLQRKKIIIGLIIIFAGLLLAACSGTAGTDETGSEFNGELVVYSSRNERFVDALLAKFQQDTGIEVMALHGGEAIINRVRQESGNVRADVLIANDAGALEFLRLEGLLQAAEPAGIGTIDPAYRASDNSWFALSARTRVFMYNKELISEEEMPKQMWALADPAWKGLFAITRGGNASMIGHVSALRHEWGDEKTLQWLMAIKENAGAVMQGHGDIRRAVGAGEFVFGLVNNYYYHQQLQEPEHNNVGVIYPDQGEDEMGAVINAAGVGFVNGAPNADNARIFLEWILLPENQKEFSFASLEVPLNPEIEAASEAAGIGTYKVQGMPLRELGQYWHDTLILIEESGLDLELR